MRSTIIGMFASGLLPGAAHREFLQQLRSECKNDLEYHIRLSDRSEAPRREDFNRIYYDFTKERFGTGSITEMFIALKRRIKDLKEKDAEFTIEYQKFDEEINQPFIMVVITPLMKRFHNLVSICLTFSLLANLHTISAWKRTSNILMKMVKINKQG